VPVRSSGDIDEGYKISGSGTWISSYLSTVSSW
jgi:hypothetical protein